MLVHDIIKIRYTDDGYLANYPYHMMSDREMFSAFMGNEVNFFLDNYPCMDKTNDVLKANYYQLALSICYYTAMNEVAGQEIPDWVYSYLLGSTISINSDRLDIHDLNASLHTENADDAFTIASSSACMHESLSSLGLMIVNQMTSVSLDEEQKQAVENKFRSVIIDRNDGVDPPVEVSLYDIYHSVNGDTVHIRPITMFGEPHVLKSLRLKQMRL